MPLIKKWFSSREDSQSSDVVEVERAKDSATEENDYDDFQSFEEDDEALDSDMEGSIMERPRPKKRPSVPVLPQRNETRASMILKNVLMELQSLDGLNSKTASSTNLDKDSISDPHEMYLSSEEDASLSDYDDSLLDFDAESPTTETDESVHNRTGSRGSEEAKVMTFKVVSKPRMIEIQQPRSRSTSNPSTRQSSPPNYSELPARMSLDISALNRSAGPSGPRRSSPLSSVYNSPLPSRHASPAASENRSSIYSTPSEDVVTTPASDNASIHPPRKSSRLASFWLKSSQSSFHLSQFEPTSDPDYAQYQLRSAELNELELSRTETRVSTMEKAEKVPSPSEEKSSGKGHKLANAIKRRPSMPRLAMYSTSGIFVSPRQTTVAAPNAIPTKHSNSSNMNISTTDEPKSMVQRNSTIPVENKRLSNMTTSVTYDDIMRNAIRGPSAEASPISPKRGFFGLGRNRSIRT